MEGLGSVYLQGVKGEEVQPGALDVSDPLKINSDELKVNSLPPSTFRPSIADEPRHLYSRTACIVRYLNSLD